MSFGYNRFRNLIRFLAFTLVAVMVLPLVLTACDNGHSDVVVEVETEWSNPEQTEDTSVGETDGGEEITSEVQSDTSSEDLTEEQTEDTTEVNTEEQTEIVTEAPVYEPGENYGDIIITKVYGTCGKSDGVLSTSFIELYNLSESEATLGGVALYLGNGKTFEKFDLSPYTIKGHGYFLIKCKEIDGYDKNCEVLRIEKFDAKWDFDIQSKEFELVLSDTEPTPGGDFLNTESIISYVAANETPSVDIYRVDSVSKNKIIIRTSLEKDVGYHVENIANAGTERLSKILPVASSGTNEYTSVKVKEVTFSIEGGVYETTKRVELFAPEGWTVYYTINGKDPRTFGEKYENRIQISKFYSTTSGWGETIKLGITSDASCKPTKLYFGGTTVKAYATDGVDSTAVYTQTYFISSTLAGTDTKVLNLSVDANKLLASDAPYYKFSGEGIVKKPRATVFLELFDEDGKKSGSSWAEVAVNGNGTSALPMKSLRFYLKKPTKVGEGENDPSASSFDFDLFDGSATNSLGQKITSFDRFLIRNSGNDFGVTMLRDVYAHKLSEGLNLDHMAYTPMLVFINGEFWGMYNCRERYCEEYFVNHYGILEENVCMLENVSPITTNSWDTDYVANTGDDGSHDIYAKEFNDLVQYMKDHDLSVAEHYNYVAERIDIDNFIDYWVFNTFLCNADWPGNNIKVWRNLDPDDPSGLDTKWRFLVLDMDSSMAYPQPGGFPNTLVDWNKFQDISDSTRCGAMMYNLLANKEFKDKFICRAYELVNGQFAYENTHSVLADMAERISGIIEYQFDRWPSHGSYGTWEANVTVLDNFLRDRKGYYLEDMYEYFGITEEEILKKING